MFSDANGINSLCLRIKSWIFLVCFEQCSNGSDITECLLFLSKLAQFYVVLNLIELNQLIVGFTAMEWKPCHFHLAVIWGQFLGLQSICAVCLSSATRNYALLLRNKYCMSIQTVFLNTVSSRREVSTVESLFSRLPTYR